MGVTSYKNHPVHITVEVLHACFTYYILYKKIPDVINSKEP